MPQPLHSAERLPFAESPLTRLASLLVVGALGTLGLAVTGQPAATAAVQLSARQSGSVTAGQSAAAAKDHAAPAVPKPRPAVASRSSAAHRRPARYVPSGTGMWIYEWRRTNHGNAASIVHQARRTGLSTLYLRTGSSWDGFAGGAHLRRLLTATRGTDVRVVPWDFPRLRRPEHDAIRLAQAARVRTASGLRVAAVAPDIETPSEGTFNATWRVRAYLDALRRHLPADVSIITAVPWPSRYRISDYPYRMVAAHSDVLVPMAYWYNNRPAVVTARSIAYLRRFHRPVQPVGQGYDGKLDVPGLRHNNLRRQVPAFFRSAHEHGAGAVSLWSWQAAPPAAWHALRHAQRLFRRH